MSEFSWMDWNRLWNCFRIQVVPFSACAVWLPCKIPMVCSSSNTFFLNFILFLPSSCLFPLSRIPFWSLWFLCSVGISSTFFLSFFSLGAPLINIAQICRYRRQTTHTDRDGYHLSNFFHGVHFHSELKRTIIHYIQGVPGIKVNTSGFISVAAAETKTSYTHGSNWQRITSYDFLKYSK